MKKNFIFLFFLLTPCFSFSPHGSNKWRATIELKGKGKNFLLSSEAIYGGISDSEKKIFVFGKNHMFQNQVETEVSKIFNDLCITNASGQFELELSGNEISNSFTGEKSIKGFISMKKKTPVVFSFSGKETNKKVVLRTSFTKLGFTLTQEAKAKFSDDFELILTETN